MKKIFLLLILLVFISYHTTATVQSQTAQPEKVRIIVTTDRETDDRFHNRIQNYPIIHLPILPDFLTI